MDNNSGRGRRDMNPPGDVSQNKVRCVDTSSSSQGESSRSSIAERLVSMWRSGGNFPPEFTFEGSDGVKLRESQEKCSALERANANLELKLATYEGQVMKLQMDLKKEESEKKQLMDEMKTIWNYMQDITEAMNYVTETLDDGKGHATRLESDYEQVILKFSQDNESLKTQVEQLTNETRLYAGVRQQLAEAESHLKQQEDENHSLQMTVEKYMNRLQEFENNERELQKMMSERDAVHLEEKKKMESLLASEREQFSNECKSHKLEIQKFSRQIEELTEEKTKFEAERNEISRTLAGKEEEIKAAKKSIDNCKMNVIELQSQLAEKTIHYQRANEEKNKFEMENEKNKKQISQITHDFETMKAESSMKSIQLTNLEEEKRELAQELEKSRCARVQADEKYTQEEENFKRQLAILQQNFVSSSTELQTLQTEHKRLVSKSKNDDAEIDRLRAELSRTTIQLREAQNGLEEANHKLSLMDSSKDYEVANLKVELDCLNKEMHRRISEISAEKKDLQLKYDEVKQKYDDEQNTNHQNSQNHSTKMDNLNSELAQLRKQNAEYLKQENTIKQQLDSYEKTMEMWKESQMLLTNNLQRSEENLRIAEKKVEELEKQNDSSDIEKDKTIKSLREKLTNAEEEAKNFSGKYYEANLNLNNKIQELDRDLITARANAQEAEESMAKYKDLQEDIMKKNEQNLQKAERKVQEFEKKYNDLQKSEKGRLDKLQKALDEANRRIEELLKKSERTPTKKIQEVEKKHKAILEEEREKYGKLQKQLEESEKRAREYEEKYKNSETQGEELSKKMSEMVAMLQDPVVPSPSTWKKPSIPNKKITIRSDKILPAGTVKKVALPLPPAPITPKSPGKSILKSPKPSPTKSVKLSSRIVPTPSPNGSPSPIRKTLPSAVPNTPPEMPRKSQAASPRPLSPDSCTMDIDDDDDDDDLDPRMREILADLSDNFPRGESLSQPTRIKKSPVTDRKFFKNRTSQPK